VQRVRSRHSRIAIARAQMALSGLCEQHDRDANAAANLLQSVVMAP